MTHKRENPGFAKIIQEYLDAHLPDLFETFHNCWIYVKEDFLLKGSEINDL